MRMHFLHTDIESSLPRHIHLENVYEIRFLEFVRLNSYIKIQIVRTYQKVISITNKENAEKQNL